MVHVRPPKLPWILRLKLLGITTSALGFVDECLEDSDSGLCGRSLCFFRGHDAWQTVVLSWHPRDKIKSLESSTWVLPHFLVGSHTFLLGTTLGWKLARRALIKRGLLRLVLVGRTEKKF